VKTVKGKKIRTSHLLSIPFKLGDEGWRGGGEGNNLTELMDSLDPSRGPLFIHF